MTIDEGNHSNNFHPEEAKTNGKPRGERRRLPLLVMSACPLAGHTLPALHVARELVKKGFEVIFMTSTEFRDNVQAIGAEWSETAPCWPDAAVAAAQREKIPVGPARLVFDVETVFLKLIPTRTADLRSLLERVRERDPAREVVVVTETLALAVFAFQYGAPLPRGYDAFPKSIGLNVVPLLVSSVDVAPFGSGLPPDATEAGRARNRAMAEELREGPFKRLVALHKQILTDMGCTRTPERALFDGWLESFDTMFQMCSPSMEYPRSDLHPSIRYAGALPKMGINSNLKYPSWWSEIWANAALPAGSPEKKYVIPVAQGTLAVDYQEVIMPTIKALAGRDDVIVIAMLGVKGASLPADFEIPANTRVVDYFPYDAALEHADLFVSNGGYGSMTHGVINGVPMVVAGITEDKVEVTARAEYAGLAVNLKTQTPSSEQIAAAVDKVLGNPDYKAAAVRLMKENRDMDCHTVIEREILLYSKGN
ncbi:udp-glucuronosyl udp-glucosyltransferase [Apiospora rasikravindrae]|uniref:Udp-glucuronosyl udp-glucosyltransferase n=1 Tax=Apiospora rasikravindrae TaxID=990691 RepID=A0ABR1SPC0_9PEZI